MVFQEDFAMDYSDVLGLMDKIDYQFSLLASKCQKEAEEKQKLVLYINAKEGHIAKIEAAISCLSNQNEITIPYREITNKIESYWDDIQEASSVDEYILNASNLAHIYTVTGAGKVQLIQEEKKAETKINIIKSHPNYKTWVRNSAKLKFDLIQNVMPTDILEYSDKAINRLIAYGAKILWEPYKRYMYYHLYRVYKEEIQRSAVRRGLVCNFDEFNKKAKEYIDIWLEELSNALNQEKEELMNLSDVLDAFDDDSQARIDEFSSQLETEIIDEFTPEGITAFLQQVEFSNTFWSDVDSKEDVVTSEKESFIVSYYEGCGNTDLADNANVLDLAKKIESLYFNLLRIEKNKLHFHFPLQLHLNTRSNDILINIEENEKCLNSPVNGLAQNMVASTIANIPVGKARFVFCDPSNTGVFSNFRDVGKNDAEGTRLSTFIVSVDDIRSELDKISDTIAYTINNILKGTKTTLYEHNREKTFNSSPYTFLYLMNYPQNMTAQSIQALKNIVDNGPKCGVFTTIFYAGGTSLSLLRPEEQEIAKSIAYTSSGFLQCGETIVDAKGRSWLRRQSELPVQAFDTFVNYYNEAIKESQRLTVHLDELKGDNCQAGEYRVPIGKNMGGETEYLSFFGSCQSYLVSGATRMGKTNLLHVIIYNTLKYVPDAQLYIIDFKRGIEFSSYAEMNHPSMKVVAAESVPEFGYVVLRHIEDRIKAISELFKTYKVKSWEQYYEKTGKTIPVTLVIFDEFQHLFETRDGNECNRILQFIAREGGAFNVHVILSTQSVKDSKGFDSSVKNNIFGRIVFYHSKDEYKDMLWNDSRLGETLSGDARGKMVLAYGEKDSQRLLQCALAKPIDVVCQEMSKDLSQGRYKTKLLLNSVKYNPFSIFSAIINGQYTTIKDADCTEIMLGSEVGMESDDLINQIENGITPMCNSLVEKSFLCLSEGPNTENENILIVGNNENMAESMFQMSIYCVLAKQIKNHEKSSIVVLAPETSTKIMGTCKEFKEYIDHYGQEDDLSKIDLEKKKYLFVFGLQNFRSLGYQVDWQYSASRQSSSRANHSNILFEQDMIGRNPTDGQILQDGIKSGETHVIVWHTSVNDLASMFGGEAKIQDFIYKFKHRIALHMNDRNESRLFVNSDACVDLSENAALYVKMNKERFFRPYEAMDKEYCSALNKKLSILDKEINTIK